MSDKQSQESENRDLSPETIKVNQHTIDLLVANVIPTTKYFESRFDFMQHQIDQLRQGQKELQEAMNYRFEQVDHTIRDFKIDVDKRFEQVDKRFEQVDKRFEQVDKRFEQIDKRFEQMIAALDRLSEKLDHRDERQRNFTLRMFSLAISISFLGVLGVLLKIIGVI